MFGNNLELPSNRMLSYETALTRYNSIKPIRGRSDQNTRPLANRRNDNLTIRQLQDSGDIVVRLYYTDVITYHTDGTITLIPYGSALTNRLIWSVLAPHANPYWSGSKPNVTEVFGRFYHTPEYARIQPKETGWELIGGNKPIEVPYLNRKLGRQALRDHNYDMFVVWLETQIRLGLDPRHQSWRSSPFQHTGSMLVGYLRDGPSGWAEIAGRMSTRCSLTKDLESIRSAIYQYEMCYEDIVYDYFESYTAMTNAFKQIAKVG